MLQNSKNRLFDDTLKLKLENPEMTLDHWMAHINQNRCSFRVEKVQLSKKLIGGKRYGYRITTTDPLWQDCSPSTRTRGDFHLLQGQLEKRFPNAVVPRILKKEVDNLHMMELYLTELAISPFFRMDVAFSDFLNGKLKEYKQTKKNDRKHSQGTLRWLQQTTEYREVDMSDDTIKSIKIDLDQLRRVTVHLVNGIAVQIRTMTDLQNCIGSVAGSLGEFLAVEQSSENKAHGSASGLPPGKVKGLVTDLINLHTNHQLGLQQSYDGGSLERLTVHHLNIFIREIQGFKRLIDQTQHAKNDYDKAKSSFDAIPNENPQKEASKQALVLKDVVFYKERRALAYELERFRTYKTVKVETIYRNMCKFHLRGATRILEEWEQSGIRLDKGEEEAFLQKEKIYSHQEANPVGRNRAGSINGNTKRTVALELKSLEVIQSYSPSMLSGKYLKIAKGELLTGHQLGNGDWQVTNNKGSKGLVKAANVQIAQQQDGFKPSAPGPAPGLPQTQMINGDDGEWSFSDEGNDPGLGSARSPGFPGMGSVSQPPMAPPSQPMPPPQPVGLPPGLGAAAPPTMKAPIPTPGIQPYSGENDVPMAQEVPPQHGFGQPAPPATKPVGGFNPVPPGGPPPVAIKPIGAPVPPGSKPIGGEGNMPMPPASKPVGAPVPPGSKPIGGPVPPASKPIGGPVPPASKPIGGPAPPASKPIGGPAPPASKPIGGPVPPTSKPVGGAGAPPAAAKKKPKFGGGMPGRPGGAPSFLADIGKGNMNKLKKVPESEKSKEIGGGKGLSAADKSKGKKAPPAGGAGGLMGEMALAFAARKRA